ncbi:MAG: S-methyl-5-thioribose-1-phosphate isomerase [Sphaerochaetaceae bacterium]|nr:S-methyl-5-thioribose-1-phosphate isomerase [Sphaerochaetaceae bacterium]MDC7244088.1 S-methyl-5-thioribose-1-phosphate isomerase [Sphaerochaetaceae bacterium]
MERADNGLAFMLKYENIAWYENGTVRILDRRIYPIRTEYVVCKSVEKVAKAIKDMVTQSAGPYLAAAMGMVLAAYEIKDRKDNSIVDHMEKSAFILSHARPTTVEQMKRIVDGAVNIARKQVEQRVYGDQLIDSLFKYAFDYVNNNYKKYTLVGRNLANLIPKNGTILTQCFGDTIVGTTLRECTKLGNTVKVICAETRPYFQGSRLTASVACDMGFDVTVISDNMPGYVLKNKHVDIFTSASDVITIDGHIINKIGTFQIALAANYYGIPYYVTGTPDPNHQDLSRIKIEERDPELVLKALDVKVTMPGVKGYYPAFDITPPNLCIGVVTDLGVYETTNLKKYLADCSQKSE